MDFFSEQYWIARLLFERALAAIYLLAFLVAYNQFPALSGKNGLYKADSVLSQTDFWKTPGIFHWHYSDHFLRLVAVVGIVLSALLFAGVPQQGPVGLSMFVWLLLWALYLSIVNIGRRFYGFGWESILLEAGFFAAFLGPTHHAPSFVTVLLLMWLLFRVEFGAGLIKLRHDPCWRDLTCLFYHYETQPLPNPLSWYFHRQPKVCHRFGVLFSHFVQIIVPFCLFIPQPVAAIAAGLILFHQLWLIISGNYSWLNWMTVITAIIVFPDPYLEPVLGIQPPELAARPVWFELIVYLVALATIVLSIKPVKNLFSGRQLMNFSYNPFHLVGTYGAFGSITKKRYEVILEGTGDKKLTPETVWHEYGFKAKPGDLKRLPPQIAPYHLRLDWMMWFLPFSATVLKNKVLVNGYEPWFLEFVKKLLANDKATIKLLRKNPFPEQPPQFIRAQFYHYQYTTYSERRQTGNWWKRIYIGEYLEPISRELLSRFK